MWSITFLKLLPPVLLRFPLRFTALQRHLCRAPPGLSSSGSAQWTSRLRRFGSAHWGFSSASVIYLWLFKASNSSNINSNNMRSPDRVVRGVSARHIYTPLCFLQSSAPPNSPPNSLPILFPKLQIVLCRTRTAAPSSAAWMPCEVERKCEQQMKFPFHPLCFCVHCLSGKNRDNSGF